MLDITPGSPVSTCWFCKLGVAATTYWLPETARFLEDSLPLELLPLCCSFEVGVAPEEEEMICQPLAPCESCVAVRSSSPGPPDWLGPWELLLFSLGDSILLQVAASRAKGDGWDSWPEKGGKGGEGGRGGEALATPSHQPRGQYTTN